MEAVDDDAESAMNRIPSPPKNSQSQENVDRAKYWLELYGVTASDIKDKVKKYFGSDSVRSLNEKQMNKLEDMIKTSKE